ncbi:MAG: ABC transporter permease subunit [Polyangia bacterium]
MTLLGAALSTSALALVAVLLAAPAALWTAWSIGGARLSLGALRLLAAVPLAALALSVAPSSHAWLLLWAVGAYAPLTLGLLDVRAATDQRQLGAALALGMSPFQAFRHVLLPVTARPVLAMLLGVLARLVGEAGLFLVIGGAPVLGALAWLHGNGAVLALLVVALGWAALAERLDPRTPVQA